MATLGLNDPPGFARVFFFPFRDDVVVSLDFKQTFEDQREALRGRFFEREYLDVVFVETKVSPVAFEMRLAEVIVEESVVFELRQFELVRGEVQRLFQDSEGFLFIEQPHCQEIAYL